MEECLVDWKERRKQRILDLLGEEKEEIHGKGRPEESKEPPAIPY